MDAPNDDPHTMPSGLTFVQNELWEGDRLTMPIRRVPPGEENTPKEPIAIRGANLEKEDEESDGEYLALLMLAQHPSLHQLNSSERVVTEYVNELLQHQHLRLSKEIDDSDENIDTYQEIISMLQEAGFHPKERDDGTIDGCDMLDMIGHLIKLANLPDPLPRILPDETPHVCESLQTRVEALERKFEKRVLELRGSVHGPAWYT